MHLPNFLNKDLYQIVKVFYQDIDRRYKIAFSISLLFTTLVFFIFISQFLFHNHGMRLPWIGTFDQWQHGRWFSIVFFKLFYNADIPVFTPIAASVLNVINGILLVIIWERGKRKLTTFHMACVVLLVSIYPAMLSAYYYTWLTEVFIGAIFLSTLGLTIASSLKWWRILIGSLLIMCALATYQTCLSVFATIFMGLLVLEIVESQNNTKTFFNNFQAFLLPKLLSIAIGGILYRLSLPLLGIKVGESHATKAISFPDLPSRFLQVAKESFSSLIYTQPEFFSILKYGLLASLIFSAAVLVKVALSNSPTRAATSIKIIFLLISLAVLIISTKAMYLISSDNNFSEYRYNFATGFLYAFAFFTLFYYCQGIPIKNITFILCLYVILTYAQANLVRQGILLRGQVHDLALANRILSRIENLPDLDFNKPYYLVRTGPLPNIRMKSIRSQGHNFLRSGDGHMDNGEITAIWCSASVMSILGSKVNWMGKSYMPDFKKKMKEAEEIAKKQGRKPWPDQSSIFIHDDWIIVYM